MLLDKDLSTRDNEGSINRIVVRVEPLGVELDWCSADVREFLPLDRKEVAVAFWSFVGAPPRGDRLEAVLKKDRGIY